MMVMPPLGGQLPGQQGAGGARLDDDGLPVADQTGRPLDDALLFLIIVPHAGGGIIAVVHRHRPAVGPLQDALVLQLFQILPHRHQGDAKFRGELADADLLLALKQGDDPQLSLIKHFECLQAVVTR